jgi:DNA modification methylase
MNSSPASKQKRSINSGTIIRLGDHILGCGDARDKKFVAKVLDRFKVNLILADVPYAVGYVESKADFQTVSKNKTIANDHIQSESEYIRFTREWLEAVKPHLSRKNGIYIFNSDKMIFALREGMKDAGFTFAQLLIWVKNHSVLGRMDYLPQHELIAYGWHGTHEFMKSKDKSVICHPKPSKSRLHPTMKPVGLLRKLILNSSRIGDTVYDSFGGAGSTLIAAEQTRRKCIMIEIDPEYCQTIVDRFERLTGLVAEKIYG